MKTHTALLSLAILFALASAEAGAVTAARRLTTAKSPVTGNELAAPTPRELSVAASAMAQHRYQVRDEKGPLMSCVAPEMDVNSETDVFKNCTLAPGRSLDDFMHSVIKAIHQEQQQKAGSDEDPKQTSQSNAKPEQNAAQK